MQSIEHSDIENQKKKSTVLKGNQIKCRLLKMVKRKLKDDQIKR